jgi:hypothetical protein
LNKNEEEYLYLEVFICIIRHAGIFHSEDKGGETCTLVLLSVYKAGVEDRKPAGGLLRGYYGTCCLILALYLSTEDDSDNLGKKRWGKR